MEGYGGLGTWRRYKLGQKQFTTWLKQTSEKIASRKQEPGHDGQPEQSNASNGVPSDPNTTGKKRKNKKGKEKISLADIDPQPTSDGGSVHWSQLEAMATTIVENADPDEIPDAPIRILRDVVNLRKRSARFFSRHAKESKDETLKIKNATHEHMIGVLDRVLGKFDTLKSRVRASSSEPKANAEGEVDINDLGNMFEHLEVQPAAADDGDDEQSSDAESHVGESSRRTKKNKKGAKKSKKGKKSQRASRSNNGATSANANGSTSAPREPGRNWVEDMQFGEELDGDDEFDYYMLVYCFFADFNTIRNYVCERWCDYYYDNSVSLNTLAVITNAACEFFNQMEVDLRRLTRSIDPAMANYKVMTEMLFFNYGIDHIDYDSYLDLDEEQQDERIFTDEADWLALTTYWDMQNAVNEIPPRKVPTLPPSQKTPYSHLYGSVKLEDKRELLSKLSMEYILEATVMKALKKNNFEGNVLPAESEILLNCQRALVFRNVTAARVFSTQLYLDIRQILEHKVEDGFKAMQETAHWIDRTLEAHKADAVSCRRSELYWLKDWQTDVRHYMLEDITLVDKKHRYQVNHIDEPVPEFSLHKCDPVWMGLVDFRAKLMTNKVGERFVSRSPLIEAAAYLYSAAKAALVKNPDLGTLPPWLDMEKFMDTYGDDSQFKLGIRHAAQSAFATLNNWQNMLTVFVTWADDFDKTGSRSKEIAGRKLAQSIKIRDHFIDRYGYDDLADEGHFISAQMTLDYAHNIVMDRLEIDVRKYTSRANRRRILEGFKEVHGPSGDKPVFANGEKPTLEPLKLPSADDLPPDDEVADDANTPESVAIVKELRRKAMLAQMSPLEVLKILDDSVESLVQDGGLLSLDYFDLFDQSKALLCAVQEAYGPEFVARVQEEGSDPDWLVKIPILIARDMKASAPEDPTGAKLLAVLVKSVRDYLEGRGKE